MNTVEVNATTSLCDTHALMLDETLEPFGITAHTYKKSGQPCAYCEAIRRLVPVGDREVWLD